MISLSSRPENLKRDVMRFLLYPYDSNLQKAAQETRLVEPGDFAIFYDKGFTGVRK
jgi:hypothetical protein